MSHGGVWEWSVTAIGDCGSVLSGGVAGSVMHLLLFTNGVYSQTRTQQHNQLSRHHHTQDRRQHKHFNLQETHLYRYEPLSRTHQFAPPHPTYTAIKFLYKSRVTSHRHKIEYKHEVNIIQNILHNNSFPIKSHKTKHKLKHAMDPPKLNQKWATFTYAGKETTFITKIFTLRH
jgi:hypothetical protein